MTIQRITLLAGLVAVLSAPPLASTARAQAGRQERKSPLADAPAIRNRVELRQGRFELGVGGGSTIGQDFYHAVLVGPRLSFHFNELLAIAATAGFNVTPNLETGFNSELLDSLETRVMPNDRAPLPEQAIDGMNQITFLFSAGAELMPFAGKLSLFGKVFANYDFYFFGGLGGINFQAAGAAPACASNDKKSICPVTGMKFGPAFGMGAHAFINDFVALNADVRDYLIWSNNPSGRDVNGDGLANEFDLGRDNNFVVTLNVTFFLPSKGRVTD